MNIRFPEYIKTSQHNIPLQTWTEKWEMCKEFFRMIMILDIILFTHETKKEINGHNSIAVH